jgi:hypothetical protein
MYTKQHHSNKLKELVMSSKAQLQYRSVHFFKFGKRLFSLRIHAINIIAELFQPIGPV